MKYYFTWEHMSLNPWDAQDCSLLFLSYFSDWSLTCEPESKPFIYIFLFYSYILEKKNSQNSSKEIREHTLTEVEVKSWKNQLRSITEQ